MTTRSMDDGRTHEHACGNEKGVKDALLKLGASEDQATGGAHVIWAITTLHSARRAGPASANVP
jgi:hypothetical protein